jgi:hypothetical protein
MHRHKTVAQILLMLFILNSALAAPVLLQRNEPQAVTPVGPDAPPSIDLPSNSQSQLPDGPEHPSQSPSGHRYSTSMTGSSGYLDYAATPSGNLKLLPPTVNTGHSEIQPDTSAVADPQHGAIQPYTPPPASPEHPQIQPYTSPPASPQHGAIQPYTSPPASPQHGAIQPYTSPPASPQHDDVQPHTSPPASPAHSGVQEMTIPPQPVDKAKAPSKATWKQKILTPENIKTTKYGGGAALAAAAYLGLLIPDIIRTEKSGKGGHS